MPRISEQRRMIAYLDGLYPNGHLRQAKVNRAKQAYKLLGKTDEWEKYLEETKEKYKRRPALQCQLARL